MKSGTPRPRIDLEAEALPELAGGIPAPEARSPETTRKCRTVTIFGLNWKFKSALQRACAALPVKQEAAYYFLQRSFGRPLRYSPLPNMKEAGGIVAQLAACGLSVRGARVMETGTGRRVDMPLAFYLCGARSVCTYDLHRYLKPELVQYSVAELLRQREQVKAIFQNVADGGEIDARLDALAAARDVSEIFEIARIDYRAPADASRTGLLDGSIDLHFSYTVMEHIPAEVLAAILGEANRVLAPGGLACHHIDLSDHFSHDDHSISAINFLQFGESQWERYAGNRFAYHNRRRYPDYMDIYKACEHQIVECVRWADEGGMRELRGGFALAPEFQRMSPEVVCTVGLRVVSRPKRTAGPESGAVRARG
jgi:SAM-dependent methyltransferase